VLGFKDSGTSANHVAWTCAGAIDSCIIQPSVAASGCSVYSGSIYVCPVTSCPNTAYEAGVRLRQARQPNYTFNASYPNAQGTYYFATTAGSSSTVLAYGTDPLTPASWTMGDAAVYVWSGAKNWYPDIFYVSSVNTGAKTVTLASATGYPMSDSIGGFGSRYFVFGDRSLIDTAGEFACTHASPALYVQPNASVSNIEIPTSQYALKLIGENDPATRLHVNWIDFTGFLFRYTDWPGPAPSGNAHGTLDHLPAAVFATNTEHITFRNCHVTEVGGNGFTFHGLNVAPTLAGVQVDHVGHFGVTVEDMVYGAAILAVGDVSTGMSLQDFSVHDVGEIDGFGSGIFIWNASSVTATRGSIWGGPRHGWYLIATGAQSQNAILAANSHLTYAGIRNLMQDSGDGGLIHSYYMANGTVISGVNYYTINYYDQVRLDGAFAAADQHNAAPSGSYMDAATYYQDVKNTVVTNAQNGNPCIWTVEPYYTRSNISCANDGGTPTFDGAAVSDATGPGDAYPFDGGT
jgi:hypothetical protein